MNTDLLADLSRAGWTLISQRTTPNGLILYKMGRDPETGLGGALRRWAETEERSAEGWMMEIEPPRLLGFAYQERMKL